jgi:uncharacterized membrane protein
LKSIFFLVLTCIASVSARAHGFEERYDLPVPLAYVIAGACATVLLTFVVAVFFMRQSTPLSAAGAAPSAAMASAASSTSGSSKALWLIRSMAWLLFALTMASALWGSSDPLMNLAPTLVWIVWWVGLSFAVVLLGNVWPALDPWGTTYEMLNTCAKRLGLARGLYLGWAWPAWLGAWPAAALLLAWCWLEVVYPIATAPFKLGCAALLWTVVNIGGMTCFGREVWQRHADVFALYFASLARMAPVRWNAGRPIVQLRSMGTGLIDTPALRSAGQVGFVMAMLSTVLFDGLHSSAAWLVFEQGLKKVALRWMDVNGYFAGTVGLVVVWLVFLVAYVLTCFICARLMAQAASSNRSAPSAIQIATLFAPTLIPIAAAYNIAHNFSNLLIQGQTILQLLSDPLGRQWDLFGTAKWYPDISIVDAKLTWYVAVVSIVLGHVVSIWLSHRVALRQGLSPHRTTVATLPFTLLMMAYTAISLMVIAEPMVKSTP